ncbi:hypothetical protein chiPu_0005279 [Chiloscyllium punctatum]|uniref:Uncharacterized protein n=1 Tax=Chiloscyllium punctatum TaxID=137246 RepID=A0A401S8X3_CHIPU|nr:hypothetical protein [Chiloscyllium punctatum]
MSGAAANVVQYVIDSVAHPLCLLRKREKDPFSVSWLWTNLRFNQGAEGAESSVVIVFWDPGLDHLIPSAAMDWTCSSLPLLLYIEGCGRVSEWVNSPPALVGKVNKDLFQIIEGTGSSAKKNIWTTSVSEH